MNQISRTVQKMLLPIHRTEEPVPQVKVLQEELGTRVIRMDPLIPKSGELEAVLAIKVQVQETKVYHTAFRDEAFRLSLSQNTIIRVKEG